MLSLRATATAGYRRLVGRFFDGVGMVRPPRAQLVSSHTWRA